MMKALKTALCFGVVFALVGPTLAATWVPDDQVSVRAPNNNSNSTGAGYEADHWFFCFRRFYNLGAILLG